MNTPKSRYEENRERSAEYLRLALAHMGRQPAVTYALWYEYVSGTNKTLISAIDSLLASGRTIDDETTRTLYEEHIAQANETTALRATAGVERVLKDIGESVAQALSTYRHHDLMRR